ncbi:DUF4870 domain-containing protein [Limisphaera ngatamarikiensis]
MSARRRSRNRVKRLTVILQLMDPESLAPSGTPASAPPPAPDPREPQTRLWALILHLSLFAGYVVPLAGLLVPILIWQLKKASLPGLDAHGKAVANWILSALLYCAVAFVLLEDEMGLLLILVLGVCSVVFPIVGAIKAHAGQVWPYPLAIRFFC